MDKEVREHIGICVAGTVLFTLLLNGTTAELVYTRLKLYPMSKYRQEHLSFILNAIDLACNRKKDELKDYWLFKGTGKQQNFLSRSSSFSRVPQKRSSSAKIYTGAAITNAGGRAGLHALVWEEERPSLP